MCDHRRVDVMSLPKAELHVHIEGTLEPELMFELGTRNNVQLPYRDVESVRKAYTFSNLQSFLDIYYQACAVLVEAEDFFDLTRAYFERARTQGVRHAEIFFDPQTHTARGIPIDNVISGIQSGLQVAATEHGITSRLIMCFLRHLPEQEAMDTFDSALPYGDVIHGVGLDSSESGNPPEKFEAVFGRARAEGLHAVAHAGEEGPPEYIWQALDILGAERIDHGVRCIEDQQLVDRLVREQVPLTVCPLSNVKLRVVDSLGHHPLGRLLAEGVRVTLNSDDPAYFGGYVGDNFAAVQSGCGLTDDELVQLARNSFEASFLSSAEKERHLAHDSLRTRRERHPDGGGWQ
jgi:adenine deaminase